MAYWPSRGSSLNNIDYSQMQVGVIQYFIHHKLSYCESNARKEEEHIFAYVKWKEQHPHFDWFGVSATVCIDSFESSSPCCLIPIQRIGCRCASIVMNVDINGIPVFIACPIALRYSV